MKKIFRYAGVALVSAAVLALAGCGSPRGQAQEGFVVSILPLKYLVERITGGDFPVEVLVPPGSGPESYEPTPAQMMAVGSSKAVMLTGLIDFERTLTEKLSGNGKVAVCDLSQGIQIIAGSCSHTHGVGQGSARHAHGHGVDPHTWTSPRCLATMAGNVLKCVQELYPDSARYRENYDALVADLQRLDAQVAAQLAASGVKRFYIYHPALTYYARDYGLEQVSIEHEGKEPSASHLSQLIVSARHDGARAILYQRQFSKSTVDAIAADIGALAVEIDPLREDVSMNTLEMTAAICFGHNQTAP